MMLISAKRAQQIALKGPYANNSWFKQLAETGQIPHLQGLISELHSTAENYVTQTRRREINSLIDFLKSSAIMKLPNGNHAAPWAFSANPAKKKKPRTAAQKAATARMLAANANRPKHVRTAAQKKARKAANTVPGYYPNPSPKNHSSLYWVFTVHDGYVSFRTDSGYTGSTPFAAIPELNKSKNPGYAYAKWVGLKRGQFEVLDDRAMKRNPATKSPGIARLQKRVTGKYIVQRMRLVASYAAQASRPIWVQIATFAEQNAAMEYARALSRKYPKDSFRVID